MAFSLLFVIQIPSSSLDNFLLQIEQGYVKYSNPYHNNLHAADVTQTVHYILWVTGLAVSLTIISTNTYLLSLWKNFKPSL